MTDGRELTCAACGAPSGLDWSAIREPWHCDPCLATFGQAAEERATAMVLPVLHWLVTHPGDYGRETRLSASAAAVNAARKTARAT